MTDSKQSVEDEVHIQPPDDTISEEVPSSLSLSDDKLYALGSSSVQPNFQLVFGMDDDSSETSFTSPSPLNPLLSYLPQSQDLSKSQAISESQEVVQSSESQEVVLEFESEKVVSSSEVVSDPKSENSVNVELHSKSEEIIPDSKSESQEIVQDLEPQEDVLESQSEDSLPQSESLSIQGEPVESHPLQEPVRNITLDLKPHLASEDLPSPSDSLTSLSTPLDFNTSLVKEGVLFSGIYYLGSSTVDAPVSETEANRKMTVLKNQAGEPIPIVLSIPEDNDGSIVLKDPSSNQVLVAFFVRHVLFCARGQQDTDLSDCLAINVLHKRSGMYHCHIFRCELPDACQKVFEAIGKAFRQKPGGREGSPQLSYELDVMIEIHEEDGRGNFSPVSMDKDCFKIRSNVKKKIIITISQHATPANVPLKFDRCFGLLMAIGHDLPRNQLQLLDNAQTSSTSAQDTLLFTIYGIWDTNLPYLTQLTEDPTKSAKYHVLTVATDIVSESVSEPIRISREIKVRVVKSETFGSLFSTLTRRKLPVETYTLTLDKVLTPTGKHQYRVKSLKNIRELSRILSPSPASPREKVEVGKLADEVSTPSPLLRKNTKQKIKEAEHGEDSDAVDEVEDDELLVSGWGNEGPDLREDLLKQWSEVLEKWDGKDRWDPQGEKTRYRHLVKLVRKGIPSPLRCQIWQMLSGADCDPQLLEAYRILVTKDSPTESVINWDIKRTYVGHEFFQEASGKEALYKISKAYSVYDTEVGYCQGFSFMAAVLLLQKIPEEQAFAVLVKIMFSYGHRNLFKANFKELHLMFYQLERLMEEYLHELHEHFQLNSIETHMYASQWFLTIFTAKFPLHVTYRIMDIYLSEGVPIVFQIALALLKLTQRDFLFLDFEGILNFFRTTLPKNFATEDEATVLFNTAFNFTKVTQRKLKKLEKDYQIYLEQQALLEDPVVRMGKENKQLRDTVLRLQRENDDLAEELVASKVALRADMDKLEERIDVLSKESRAYKSSGDAASLLISELQEELQEAKDTYQRAMMQLTEERQQHEAAIAEYKQLFQQLDEGHQKQKEDLNQELLEVKAKLGSSGVELSDEDHQHSLSSEQRLRTVELELAQTKLALVEAQCKNQELEHKVIELSKELAQVKGKPSWLSRFS